MLLYVMTRGLATDVDVKGIAQFKVDFLDFVRREYPQILLRIAGSGELDTDDEDSLTAAAAEYFKR